jgi:uncharacterized protein
MFFAQLFLIQNCDKYMMHPNTKLGFVSPEIGYGVFATQFIPKGTITWVLDDLDREIDESYLYSIDKMRRETVLKYAYRNNCGQYIFCWDIARFVNHSFNSNCISTAYDFEIAIRDIYPGEELTNDYGYFNLDEPFDCLPETGTSRTKVMPDDILHFYQEWDEKVFEAIKYFKQVEQPLKSLINSKYFQKVNAIIEGKERMDSILSCYYDRSQHKLKIAV